jgi:hemolysin-activating ACP:hemolysin acyltransferase
MIAMLEEKLHAIPFDINYFISLWRLAKSKEKRGGDEPLRACAQWHVTACQGGGMLHAHDGYGRLLGMAYWSGADGDDKIELTYFFSPPGHGRAILRRLAAHCAAAGITAIHLPASVGRHGRGAMVDVARILRRLPPERAWTPQAQLHPLLAGKASEGEQEAALCGAALHLMSQVPRLACNGVGACVQLIDRADGAGHLRLVRDDANNPVGLLIWARPATGTQAAGLEGGRPHASELNVGGDLLLLEHAALDEGAAQSLVDFVAEELVSDSGGLRIALQRQGQALPEIVPIARGDVPQFIAWFGQQLAAQVSALKRPSC